MGLDRAMRFSVACASVLFVAACSRSESKRAFTGEQEGAMSAAASALRDGKLPADAMTERQKDAFRLLRFKDGDAEVNGDTLLRALNTMMLGMQLTKKKARDFEIRLGDESAGLEREAAHRRAFDDEFQAAGVAFALDEHDLAGAMKAIRGQAPPKYLEAIREIQERDRRRK